VRRSSLVLLAVAIAVAGCGPRLGAAPLPAGTSVPVCSPVPSFGPAIDASYQKDLLLDQQRIVPVVGMDRLEPIEPAFEFFAAVGIANGTNIVNYALRHAGSDTAVVEICRADGTVIAADMYRPFPSARPPIWAVRSYRLGR
jgi:hypothetical protein